MNISTRFGVTRATNTPQVEVGTIFESKTMAHLAWIHLDYATLEVQNRSFLATPRRLIHYHANPRHLHG